MRGTEHGCINRVRIKVVLGPLRFMRVIAYERDRSILPVKNGRASFQF